MKERIVVLGAGPAGITAAWQLSERGFAVTVLEKDGMVGGMGKTLKIGQYKVDYGPHTFHIRDTKESREIVKTIRPFFGENPLILSRGTRVLLRGKYYNYPLELFQVLSGVSPLLSAKILYDYIKATVKSALAPPRREDSFEEWGIRNLGRTLYDLCFGIYSARVWGLPTSQISSKQAQRVAKLNLKNIILRTLGIKADPVTYFTKYMYPQDGISTLYDGMANRILELGNQVMLHSSAIRVERAGDRITRVVYRCDGRETAIECSGVLATVPLPHLVKMIAPPLPGDVLAHAERLRYRSLKVVYIVVDRERLTDFHWVYLLDEHFRCNRISEQKNVSPSMIPPGQTVLCIEISCFKGDEVWNASDDEVFRMAFDDLRKTGFGVKESEVCQYFVHSIETAYPVYELNFEDHLIPVLEGVHGLQNLLTLGRHGLFLNNSMDDNVLLGTRAASHISSVGFQSGAWLEEMLAFMNLRFQGK